VYVSTQVAVVNTKFPELGELVLRRAILQFRRAFKRNDKPVCMAATKLLAHLVMQQVGVQQSESSPCSRPYTSENTAAWAPSRRELTPNTPRFPSVDRAESAARLKAVASKHCRHLLDRSLRLL
jgi:hypothetical protein